VAAFLDRFGGGLSAACRFWFTSPFTLPVTIIPLLLPSTTTPPVVALLTTFLRTPLGRSQQK
jgi:hypothetical protein